jgi:hypothetical protein
MAIGYYHRVRARQPDCYRRSARERGKGRVAADPGYDAETPPDHTSGSATTS